MIGLVELLLQTDLKPDQREYAETIKASADVLLEVVGDVLDFSKIESGKLSFDNAAFDLRELLGELDRIFTHTARRTRNRIETSLDIEPGIQSGIIGDRGRIRQVFSNLLSNSIKFTNAGQITLAVRLRRHPSDGLLLSATVTDNGIGLSSDSLRALTTWQPFSQADTSTSRLYGGSGLGLCIVKSLVDAMGGGLTLDSPGLGHGCRVEVEMIVQAGAKSQRVGDQDGPNDRRRSRSPQPRLAQERDRYSILVAEDNPVMAKVTTALLRKQGFKVDLVKNGKEAVERAQEKFEASGRMKSYDLAIVDLMMPVLDGKEACYETF